MDWMGWLQLPTRGYVDPVRNRGDVILLSRIKENLPKTPNVRQPNRVRVSMLSDCSSAGWVEAVESNHQLAENPSNGPD